MHNIDLGETVIAVDVPEAQAERARVLSAGLWRLGLHAAQLPASSTEADEKELHDENKSAWTNRHGRSLP